MTWLGPSDDWPTHPRSEARKKLKLARDIGWSFKPGGHFGSIRCPYPAHHSGPERCILLIHKTSGPQDGSIAARKIQQKIARCQKRTQQSVARSPTELRDELDQIEILIGHAQDLQMAGNRRTQAARKLDDFPADGTKADEERAIEESEAFEQQGSELELGAWIGAMDFGLGEPWPPERGAARLFDAVKIKLIGFQAGLTVDETDPSITSRIEQLLAQLPDSDSSRAAPA
jgi:hypothetical protein